MLCSCRFSPLRQFVQGMSQLHISTPAAATSSLLPLPTLQTFRKSPFTTTSIPSRKNDRRRVSEDTTRVYEAARHRKKEQAIATMERLAAESGTPINTDVDTDPDADKTATRQRPHWQIQKEALKEKFPEGWRPHKKLSPDAMAGIKALHAQFPEEYNTRRLANEFQMSPEAIRRILKSNWRATPEEEEKRQERWFRRGISVWTRKAELGMKPPRKWRKEGVVRDPSYHEDRKAAIERRKRQEEAEDTGEKLQRKLSDTIF